MKLIHTINHSLITETVEELISDVVREHNYEDILIEMYSCETVCKFIAYNPITHKIKSSSYAFCGSGFVKLDFKVFPAHQHVINIYLTSLETTKDYPSYWNF